MDQLYEQKQKSNCSEWMLVEWVHFVFGEIKHFPIRRVSSKIITRADVHYHYQFPPKLRNELVPWPINFKSLLCAALKTADCFLLKANEPSIIIKKISVWLTPRAEGMEHKKRQASDNNK